MYRYMCLSNSRTKIEVEVRYYTLRTAKFLFCSLVVEIRRSKKGGSFLSSGPSARALTRSETPLSPRVHLSIWSGTALGMVIMGHHTIEGVTRSGFRG